MSDDDMKTPPPAYPSSPEYIQGYAQQLDDDDHDVPQYQSVDPTLQTQYPPHHQTTSTTTSTHPNQDPQHGNNVNHNHNVVISDLASDPDFRRAREIMNTSYLGCLMSPIKVIVALGCPCCLFANTYKKSNQGSFLVGVLFYPCLACFSRDFLFKSVDSESGGFCINCILHCCFPLNVLSLVQEARAADYLSIARKRVNKQNRDGIQMD